LIVESSEADKGEDFVRNLTNLLEKDYYSKKGLKKS